jgi:quercetin dioxygenase-like cupin family protein
MSIPSSPQAVIVQADAGKELDFGPDGVPTVMLAGEQTAGALTVIRGPVVPGAGPPLHVHSTEDELFLVIDGHVSFFTDGHWTEVGPGGAVYFPRGTPHSYRNLTDTTSHMWILTTPSAKFDVFFERLAEQSRRPGGPDMDEILAMHRDHSITLLGPV